jgi:formate dehydrogenase subunit gamma
MKPGGAASAAPPVRLEKHLKAGGKRMAKLVAHMRLVAGALALAFIVAISAPVSAQQPSMVNPTADAVKEQQLLQQLKSIQGRGTIPDVRSYTIEHPVGRDWQNFHSVTLRWIGAIAILGTLALLLIFYLWRGMVMLKSGRSGRTIVRFNAFERFVHWMTATCFIILAVTGLNITFGRPLFVSTFGSEAFTTWSEWAKYAHNYLSFPFTIGVVLIFLMWIGGNIPNKVDVEWFKRGGGIVGDDHPPAYRFNGGQKAIYWIVVLGGAAVAITGYVLMFPFYGTTIDTMQYAQMIHAVVAVLFVAAMLGHIYIGTIGMEGAFEAMGEGTVDVNWAKEHHRLWLEDEMGRIGTNEGRRRPAVTPAE